MAAVSPELSAKIEVWRRKCADKTITVEELQQAILAMRGARKTAAVPAKSAYKKSGRSVDTLLGELDNL